MRHSNTRSHARIITVVAGVIMLAGCDREPEPSPAPTPTTTGEGRSIFRPEFQVEPIGGEQPPEPLDARVFFAEGETLDDATRAELDTILKSPQVEGGGAIVLRGHSDAGGSDAANLRASQARAEAVRDYLLDAGVAPARISIIAFGEQNPIAPNARPDGTPDEAGRAKNRRVDIHVEPAVKEAVEPAADDAEEKKPTLAETLSDAATENDPAARAQPPRE